MKVKIIKKGSFNNGSGRKSIYFQDEELQEAYLQLTKSGSRTITTHNLVALNKFGVIFEMENEE